MEDSVEVHIRVIFMVRIFHHDYYARADAEMHPPCRSLV